MCVLASGDPGFFGIVGALSERFGRGGWWSTRRRRPSRWPLPGSGFLGTTPRSSPRTAAPFSDALGTIVGPKVAVLTSPDNPPQAIGRALAAAGRRRP